MVRDRGRAAALLAAGILALGACGGGGDDDGASGDEESPAESATDAGSAEAGPAPTEVTAEQLRTVADTAAAAESYSFEMDLTYTGLGQLANAPETMPDQASLAVVGGSDAATGRSSIEMDVTEMLAMMGGGQGDTSQFEGATVQAVVDGDTAYVNYGEMGSSYGMEADQWLQLGADQLAQSVGSVSGPGGPSPTNPGAFVDLLRGVDADEDLSVEGEEEVRGTATTHIIATANLAAAVSAAPAERQAGIEQQFGSLGQEEIPVHVWLAGDGLPRRIEIISEPGQVQTLNGAGLTVVVEAFDYGEPVEIEVPSGDAVVDGSSLVPATPPEG
jgi:hypothetical protein